MKRIVVCADGTWNRPEKDLSSDFPTNVLKLARGIRPLDSEQVSQQVFYDWGIGSYHDSLIAGATGRGIVKNITDGYRYLVQNYSPGDEIYLFGFSRGAYTVRSLCGLIYNCGILKRPDARLIEMAFKHYKRPGPAYHPDGEKSVAFRSTHSHASRRVRFVGVWDTVGALGIPLSFLGFLNREDEFYDTKIGPNVEIARHALAIDEKRSDFAPTIWQDRPGMDLQQVWFAGAHGDVGGGYSPDRDGGLLSDLALRWIIREVGKAGLATEIHLTRGLSNSPLAKLHESRKHIYRSRKRLRRQLEHGEGDLLVHRSVKTRYDAVPGYRPRQLKEYLEHNDWPELMD
jgi:uncharacterized protein (DUF2235 family)